MPEEHKTVHLDRKWLESFLTHELVPFRKNLEKLLEDEPGTNTPSMWKLLGGVVDTANLEQAKPLALGQLVKSEQLGGKQLNDQVRASAESIDTTLKKQVELFRTLEEDIQEVIDLHMKAQSDSLEDIAGRDFLERLEDSTIIIEGPSGSGLPEE
ncbi:type VII secretion system-associated protein [Streptomyces sp. YS415]|uniref:type VII secretion system-associated protein n=1 Tax=Streptomyces sp. YS415 TaxID=2944806 RepID=UPI0020203A52|nr:type VII secretion system-associated protein [Streptomyces sp. YS415]MCL7429414.1 type VII secretion system-associated protein [Streptomyces sp. YS415]